MAGNPFSSIVAALLFLFVSPVHAADPNGYTAQYECTANGPNCNVDVSGLANQQCGQTIYPDTAPTNSWPIDTNQNVICIAAGNHEGRGTLSLPAVRSGTWKVLRYYRPNDTDDEPWQQNDTNRAKLSRVEVRGGASHWIIHRLSFNRSSTYEKIVILGPSHHVIINRILQEGFYGSSNGAVYIDKPNNNLNTDRPYDVIVQNSVLRNAFPWILNTSPVQINFGNGENLWVVNNEIYDTSKHINTWQTSTETPGAVVENNDMYLTGAYYTDCAGNPNPNGNCSASETTLSTKANGSASAPFLMIHNRMWALRPCDTRVACDGGGTTAHEAVIGGGGTTGDWVMFKDNIVADAEGGIAIQTNSGDGTDNTSVVGNIFYKFRKYDPRENWLTSALYYLAQNGSTQNTHEAYFNTIIDAQGQGGWIFKAELYNSDIKCNVVMSSLPDSRGWLSSGTELNYQAFYDTPPGNEQNSIVKGLTTRSDSTTYTVGTVLITGPASQCATSNDSACYLYMVTNSSGTSAVTRPVYCTTLGCTMTDGSVQLKAIRGPYEYRRKLRTVPNGELAVIPYAVPDSSTPEASLCPSSFANRNGIGVNNQTGFAGVFERDMLGNTRAGMPGALQGSGNAGSGGNSGGTTQASYIGYPASIPGVIQAENYDIGGEGVAYHDLTPGNAYGAYRFDGVDIPPHNGDQVFHVANTQTGEWLEYTVNVTTTGTYKLQLRVASAGLGGTVHVEFDGANKTGAINIPDTGGAQNWTMVERTFDLNAGVQVMRLAIDSVNASTGFAGNIESLQFSAVTAPQQSSYLGAPQAIPGTIQAENFDIGGEGVAYQDSTPTNIYNSYRPDEAVDIPLVGPDGNYFVVDIRAGEWLEYTVNVASAGVYTVELVVASAGAGSVMHLEFNGVDKSGPITIPDTGGWTNWQTRTATVTLDAGQQIMRLAFDTNGASGYVANVERIRFIAGQSGGSP